MREQKCAGSALQLTFFYRNIAIENGPFEESYSYVLSKMMFFFHIFPFPATIVRYLPKRLVMFHDIKMAQFEKLGTPSAKMGRRVVEEKIA